MVAPTKILVKTNMMNVHLLAESLYLERRMSQYKIINKGAKKAKIAIHEESDDPRVERNLSDDDDVVNSKDNDGTAVESEDSQMLNM